MNDLRSPMEDRPYRYNTNDTQLDNDTYSTSDYYRARFDAIRQSRWFPLASVCAAVLVFSGFISYAYKQGAQTGVNATTPIVEASNTDYKEKPADPGGMDVPFQDAIVFDQLQNKDQTASASDAIESLLPPPEQPVAETTTPAATATTTTAEAVTPAVTTTTAPAVETPVTTTETAASTTTAKTPDTVAVTETKTETTVAAAPVVATTPAKTVEPTPTAVAKKMDSVAPASAPATMQIQSGTSRIQLGAFRDQAAARAAWTKFQKEFSAQLAGITPEFPQADLGAKGTFYRVQGVNLSKATADEVCRSINAARAGSCIVVK